MFETSHELDITSSRALESVIRVAQEEGVDIVLAGVATMTLDSLRKAGIVEMIGEDHVIRDPKACWSSMSENMDRSRSTIEPGRILIFQCGQVA